MRSGLVRICIGGIGLVFISSAWAQAGFGGEFDLQSGYSTNAKDSLGAALGERHHVDQNAKLRLIWSGSLASGWKLDAAYVGELSQGGGVALTRAQHESAPSFYVDPRRTSLLRLNNTLADTGQLLGVQGFDRLALTYSGAHLVLKIGRQALTWGGGLVFHPMDLFNPFPPNATYTTYKPGEDLAYGQWLFDSGADLQVVAVPRRAPTTGNLESDQASTGAKWHGFLGQGQQFGLDVMVARDYGAQVLGLGVSGSWGGATWTTEVVPTSLATGGVRTSLLANVQYAWTLRSKNVSAYAEFFHNGFGVSGDRRTLASLPVSLVERLARGEVFTISRNYLAVGMDIQWTPLLTLNPGVISNLDDGSSLVIGQAIYSLSQNTNLTAGLQWGVGARHTEYGGGLETADGSGVFVPPESQLYFRFTWYFQER